MAVSRFLAIGIFIATLGTVLHVVGMTTIKWTFVKAGSTETTFGLFEVCLDDVCSTDLLPDTDSLKGVKALMIFGVISAGLCVSLALVFSLLVYIGKVPLRVIRLAAGCLSLLAGILVIVGVILYASQVFKAYQHDNRPAETSLGYSFALSATSPLFLLIGGCVILRAKGYEVERFTS